jgi:hypothetical protein
MSAKSYCIFGLNIDSHIPLPAPPAGLTDGLSPDVVISYGETPGQLADPRTKGVRYQAGPGEFLLRVDSVARYYVRQGTHIVVQPDSGVGEEEILIFLMGSAMGALLHQRSILVLHAGAISVNGNNQSVLFTGHSGVGKSTLAAGFHKRGYPILADDVCAIAVTDGKPAIVPGFPRLKLWADVLKRLDKEKGELKSVRWTKGLQKYFLPVEPLHKDPVSLKSVFILTTTNTDKMEITPFKGGEKIEPIINNTYRLRFLNGLGGKEEHFRQCAAVATHTNVWKVIRPDRGFLLPELMDMVEANFS